MGQVNDQGQVSIVGKMLLMITVTTGVVVGSVTSLVAEPTLIDLEQGKQLFTNQNSVKHVSANISEVDSLIQKVHAGVNQYRAELNLPPLILNTQISQQAAIHSQNMAQQTVKLGHQGFEARIQALESLKYRRAAENVAYNQGYDDPAKTAIAGWIKSKNHHQNMISDFNLTGIGVAKNSQGEYYFTQIFIQEN